MKSKPYILAADDEPINRLILKEIFEDGFELQCVTNGEECVNSALARKPQLILMDANMPTMDGYEATRKIKRTDNYCDLPILIISALATKKNILKGLDSGADGYITKPFEEETLLSEVKKYL